MLMADASRVSNYPFTESSSMELYKGHRLSPGVVVGASIYPIVPGGKSGYLYISGIDHSLASLGIYSLTLADSVAGDIAASIRIAPRSTANSSDAINGSVIQLNRYCGSVVFTKDIIPILRLDLAFTSISFIFTPSVYRPRIISGDLPDIDHPLVTDDGSSISGFSIADTSDTADTVYLDDNGKLVYLDNQAAGRFVKKVTVKNREDEPDCDISCTLSNYLNIITAPGSTLRMSTIRSSNTIEIGSIDDLSTQ